MGNEVTYDRIKQMTELTAPFGQNIKLEEVVAAVREDVADISTELSLVSATVDATGSGA